MDGKPFLKRGPRSLARRVRGVGGGNGNRLFLLAPIKPPSKPPSIKWLFFLFLYLTPGPSSRLRSLSQTNGLPLPRTSAHAERQRTRSAFQERFSVRTAEPDADS